MKFRKWEGGVFLLVALLVCLSWQPVAAREIQTDREAAVSFSVDDSGPLVFAYTGPVLASACDKGEEANCSSCHGAGIVESGERRLLVGSSGDDPGGWLAKEYPLFYKDIVESGEPAGSKMRASPV
ncbi:MAG: hypothetical protein OEV42_14670 [Deltaproteobacteria bacterium]|nr:hypothetical protein [Deltaproteobacteria bacterium]